MRRVVQISDLHFGNNDVSLLKPLREAIETIGPHVLVISGDLVEHATDEEFEQARDYLRQLPQPQIIVPGNHDLAFYNFGKRVLFGLDAYRKFITNNTCPEYVDGEIAIVGANTSRIWPIRGGSLSLSQLERLIVRFSEFAPTMTRLLVTHHPFDLPEDEGHRLIVGHAKRSVVALAPVVDILLAGHIHLSSTGSTATRYRTGNDAMAFIQAGTCVSNRNKGEQNSFNSLRIAPAADGEKAVVVDRYTWDKAAAKFECQLSTEYRLGSHGWLQYHPGGTGVVQEVPGVPAGS